MVERRLAKAKVAGSNPVFRSNFKGPVFLDDLHGAGPCLFRILRGVDPSWTQTALGRARGLGFFGLLRGLRGVPQGLQRRAQIVHAEVPVGLERGADIRVPRDALDELQGDAELQQQRDGGVPAVVEAHLPRDRARPHLRAALGTRPDGRVGMLLDGGALRAAQRRQLCFQPMMNSAFTRIRRKISSIGVCSGSCLPAGLGKTKSLVEVLSASSRYGTSCVGIGSATALPPFTVSLAWERRT